VEFANLRASNRAILALVLLRYMLTLPKFNLLRWLSYFSYKSRLLLSFIISLKLGDKHGCGFFLTYVDLYSLNIADGGLT
jgi:hypothetical protein